MRSRVIAALAGALLTIVPAVSWAQQIEGAIAGQVRDNSGAVLPGVTVEASSPALIEKARTAVTDASGAYKIVALDAGEYTVTFTLTGFSTFRRQGLKLTSGFTANVDAVLQVGALEETITVSGSSPVVDVQNTSMRAVIGHEVVDSLPTGRNWANVAQLVPALIVTNASRGPELGGTLGRAGQKIVVHGSRQSDTTLRIDGMPIGQTMTGDGAAANVGLNPADGHFEEFSFSLGANSTEIESGGVQINLIPKSGGNTYVGWLNAYYADTRTQSNNMDDNLRSQGLASTGGLLKVWNFNPTLGGPIVKDKLWFFGSYQKSTHDRLGDSYFDLNDTDWVYTPDTSRSAVPQSQPSWDVAGRLTWQAATKHKIAVFLSASSIVIPYNAVGQTGITASSSLKDVWRSYPTAQVTWTAPMTNRLLFEAGAMKLNIDRDGLPQSFSHGPPATDSETGFKFRAGGEPSDIGKCSCIGKYRVDFFRFATSYVTGSHALKVGVQLWPGTDTRDFSLIDNINYGVTVAKGVPTSITFYPTPFTGKDYFFKSAAFVQELWTHKRMTVNGGLRLDTLSGGYDDYNLAATNILPARSFPAAKVMGWKDLSPRVGVAFDVFGNGRTAIKVSANRYIAMDATGYIRAEDPVISIATKPLIRSWNDALVCAGCVSHDFIPQGDPLNPAVNGELGASPNNTFGKAVLSTRYDPSWSMGWGNRPYNWEFGGSIQHQLAPNVGLDIGYYRRIFGNFTATNNVLVTAADYDTYCIKAPLDTRLPNGGGYNICGLYDLKSTAVGKVDNVVSGAAAFGNQYQHWNGLDITINARFKGLLLAGGMGTGRTMTDNCDIVTKYPQFLGAGVPADQCHQESIWLTQGRLNASYQLPWQKIDLGMVFESIPSGGVPVDFGYNAVYRATNAVIFPSLQRNLSSATSVNVNLLTPPNTYYTPRMNRIDLRFGRTIDLGGHRRAKASVDLFNLLNSNVTAIVNPTYGSVAPSPTWQQAQSALSPRFLKFSVTMDF